MAAYTRYVFRCTDCGHITERMECPDCDGSGYIEQWDNDPDDDEWEEDEECWSCDGKGELFECPECGEVEHYGVDREHLQCSCGHMKFEQRVNGQVVCEKCAVPAPVVSYATW